MEKIKLLLEQIKPQYAGQKVIIALINDIEKHNNPEDEITTRSLCYLSYWLFVLGDEENTLSFAKIVGQVTNWENDVVDACKYDCLVLSSYLYLKLKNDEQSNAFWAELLDMRFGDSVSEERKRVTKKRWNRNLTTGDLFETYDKERQAAENNNHIRGIVYYTFRTLSKLFWLYRMGGSEKYPKERITQLIDERITLLKENVDSADVRDFVGN